MLDTILKKKLGSKKFNEISHYNFTFSDIFVNSKYNLNKNQNYNIYFDNSSIRKNEVESEIKKFNITDKWLKNRGLNCRYTTFITLFYFLFREYIDETNENNFEDIKTLNKMIITLVDEVNDKNYNKIIDFIQKNKYDNNNELLK